MADPAHNVGVFSSLTDENIKHILEYVSDPRDLLACETSCSTFKNVLSYDVVWRHCPGADADVVDSYRENACIKCVLNEINEEQKSSHNHLRDVLPPESVQRMTNEVVESGIYVPGRHLFFQVRGDSLGYALDIIEAHTLGILKEANRVSIHCASKANKYPVLEPSDLRLVETILGHSSPSLKFLIADISRHVDDDTRVMFGTIWDTHTQIQLARRLASRVGIVKITYEAMIEISNHIFSVLMVLLKRPIFLLSSMIRDRMAEVFLEEEAIDLWNDVPPTIISPIHDRSPTGWEYRTHHIDNVIIPRQIEESAAQLGLPVVYSMHGHFTWALEMGQSVDDAVKAAKERYTVPSSPDDEDSFYSSSFSSGEFNSLSESSEDGYYSEYDDEECPDGVEDLVPFSWTSNHARNTSNEVNAEREDAG